MATTTAGVGLMAQQSEAGAQSKAVSRSKVRRKLDYPAARGMEVLGHAIDYLSDEFAVECLKTGNLAMKQTHPTLVALKLLHQKRREVYEGCPAAPTVGERLMSWWQRILKLGW